MDYLTRQEEIFLMAIWRLGENAYGVQIRKKIAEITQRKLSYGALYFTLDQVHKKGYVFRTEGSPTPVRGGCRKIFYQLTQEGKDALILASRLQESIWEGVSIPSLAGRKK